MKMFKSLVANTKKGSRAMNCIKGYHSHFFLSRVYTISSSPKHVLIGHPSIILIPGSQFSILYPSNRNLHIFNLSKIQIFFSAQKILIQFFTVQSYVSFGTFANQSYLFFGTFANAIYETDWFVYHLKKSLKIKLCHDN